MKLNLKRRQFIILLKWIVSLNIIFLGGTFIFHSYLYNVQDGLWENGTAIKYLLVEFSLANENVLATWYSSMLFLFVGIIFFICYLIQKKVSAGRKEKNLSYGWLVFSGIFTLLSLDEMASLHERLGNISALNPLGDSAPGWVSLLAIPIVLVGGFMAWFCLMQFKRAPQAALFAVAGILLFGSIPVQEYFEIEAWRAADFSRTWQRPGAFLLLEEGSELFGATLFLISGIFFAYSASGPGIRFSTASSVDLNLQVNKKNTLFQCAAGSIVLALLLLVMVKSNVLTHEGEISDLGRRQNWFPAAMAFLSSLLCLYLYLKPKNSYANTKNIFLYLTIFFLLISAYYGGNVYAYMYNPLKSVFKISLIALLSLTTLGLAIKMFITIKDLYTRGAIFLWACFLIPAFGLFSWYSAALIFAGFSVLTLSLLHHIIAESFVPSSIPVVDEKTV